MLKLRDFLHLPQLEPLVDGILSGEPGLTVVAGLDARPGASPTGDALLPSGRSTIFGILMQEMIEAHPGLRASIVTRDRSVAQVPKSLKYRVVPAIVDDPSSYPDAIASAAQRRPGLLVIDRLTPHSAAPALEAAASGLRVFAQIDTVLWGAEVLRQLVDLGAPREALVGITWVLAVLRLPRLCTECKQASPPSTDQLARLYGRYPYLEGLDLRQATGGSGRKKEPAEPSFCRAGSCVKCNYTGRHGDIAAFDVFRPEGGWDSLDERQSLLSLEEYMLRLAALGHLPLDDLMGFETGQLRRTYNLLAANESALYSSNTTLNRKLAELESAHQVLVQRTEVLMSLQEMAQALIGSTGLNDLAAKVCRRASDLCGADHAILYYRRSVESGERAEVLAVGGWDPALIHRQIDASLVFEAHPRSDPSPFGMWPPGIPIAAGLEGEPGVRSSQNPLNAGLSVPLLAQDRQVGLMIVHSTQKPVFVPGEVALLQTFANQAALAIQRAGLIEELRGKIVALEAAQAELVKKERLEHELELARQVQQSVIPRTFPDLPGYTFVAHYEPARQVGGDFYDVIDLDEDHFGLVIGDVSDKGMPAALYMAITRSLILAEARRELSPEKVLASVNRLLLQLGEPSRFVTVFYGVVQKSTHLLSFSRAGHDYPLLLRDGRLQFLGGQGSILGVLEEDELELSEETLPLTPGDRLVLYTDGLSDTINPDGQFFEMDRLQDVFRSTSGLPLPEMCASTFKRLRDFQGAADQFDDMSLLVLETT